jgi:arabinan endo-1,5-alpha-L-arabinosidase
MILSKNTVGVIGLAASLLLPSAYAIDNGVYTIKSKYSEKLVEVANAQTNDGANVSQWGNTNHDTQR